MKIYQIYKYTKRKIWKILISFSSIFSVIKITIKQCHVSPSFQNSFVKAEWTVIDMRVWICEMAKKTSARTHWQVTIVHMNNSNQEATSEKVLWILKLMHHKYAYAACVFPVVSLAQSHIQKDVCVHLEADPILLSGVKTTFISHINFHHRILYEFSSLKIMVFQEYVNARCGKGWQMRRIIRVHGKIFILEETSTVCSKKTQCE